MKVSKLSLTIRWLLVVCIYGVIFWFSSQPSDDSSEQSSVLVDMVLKLYFPNIDNVSPERAEATIDILTVIVRKLAHFSAFAALGFFAFGAFVFIEKYAVRYFSSLALAAALAGLDEFHQTFVDGRAGMISDVAIDSAGAVCGAFAAMTISIIWLLNKLKKDKNGA